MIRNLILSVGMPRAGSGWYYNLTQDLVKAWGGADAKDIRKKYRLSRLLTEENCNIGTLSFYRLIPVLVPLAVEPSYVIKVHAERRPLADLLIRLKIIKPTYIYRDPRDALLSAYEYGQKMSSKGYSNAFTHLKTIDDAIRFMDLYIRIAAGWMSHPQILKVKYEDFLQNYDRESQKLASYLGIDSEDESVREVIDRYRPGKKPEVNRAVHLRKGKIGRHQETFSPEQLDKCSRLFGDFLKAHGYE